MAAISFKMCHPPFQKLKLKNILLIFKKEIIVLYISQSGLIDLETLNLNYTSLL